jgi:hypothetical protein
MPAKPSMASLKGAASSGKQKAAKQQQQRHQHCVLAGVVAMLLALLSHHLRGALRPDASGTAWHHPQAIEACNGTIAYVCDTCHVPSWL